LGRAGVVQFIPILAIVLVAASMALLRVSV